MKRSTRLQIGFRAISGAVDEKLAFSAKRLTMMLALMSLMSVSACGRPTFLAGIGTGGKYSEAKEEITRKRGGNIDKAIQSLETVVREDPTYRDSLTLLGRAYYLKGRYQDALQILQRAVAVNSEDEIAWLALGISQLRLGDDEKGIKTTQGGLTLFSRVSTEGYRGYRYWDRAGKVNLVLRRAVAVARKGSEERDNSIRAVENLLAAIDEEEYYLRTEAAADRRRER